MNRRHFLKYTLTTVAGAVLLAPSVLKAQRGAKAAGLALVDPNDPTAKAVNYKHAGADIKDKALQTDRGGVKFANQKCEGCALYQKDKETTIGGKKAGGCALFPGKAVAAAGWCSSWSKKA